MTYDTMIQTVCVFGTVVNGLLDNQSAFEGSPGCIVEG